MRGRGPVSFANPTGRSTRYGVVQVTEQAGSESAGWRRRCPARSPDGEGVGPSDDMRARR